jgi:hypothetical protein
MNTCIHSLGLVIDRLETSNTVVSYTRGFRKYFYWRPVESILKCPQCVVSKKTPFFLRKKKRNALLLQFGGLWKRVCFELQGYIKVRWKHIIRILWHIEQLLGNDREISSYTIPVAKNRLWKQQPLRGNGWVAITWASQQTRTQQRNDVFFAVRAEML